MARKFLTNIDMNDNEIVNMIFQKVGTLPAVVTNGKPLHNTTDDNLYVGLNDVWVDLTTIGVTAITGDGGAITIDLTDPANPVINIADANTTTSGFMSSTDFDLLAAATSSSIADTLVLRDATGAATFDKIIINNAPTDPTDAANKAYVDNLIAAGLRIVGTIDASSNPDYPSATNGEAYHVSVAGLIGGASGVAVEIGDMVVAIADSSGGDQATVGDDFIIMQTNIDQATTTVRGAIRIATLAEVAEGIVTDAAVTPAGLSQVIQALGSSETQTALGGDGAATSIIINHTLGTQFVNVDVYDATTNELYLTDVTLTSPTSITISTSSPVDLNALRVVITGTK